jgi:hypothetical protein
MRSSFAIPLLAASFITSMAEVKLCTAAEKTLRHLSAMRPYFDDRKAVNEVNR